MAIMNEMRRMMLAQMDLFRDQHCVLDSLPIPVVQFHLAPQSRGDWPAHGANYGKVSSKKMTIYGFKLHMLITKGGLILDFELAPASVGDLAIGRELLENQKSERSTGGGSQRIENITQISGSSVFAVSSTSQL